MIVSTIDSGIGNRIKCLLSCMRLDDDVKLLWPRNRFTACGFNSLFDNDFEISSVPDGADTRFNWRWLVKEDDDISDGFAVETKEYDNNKLRKKVEENNGRNIDFEYERIPQSILDDYVAQVQKLKPVEYIQTEVETFSKNNFDENTVSVQMRSWADDPRRAPMFDINKYFEHLDNYEGNFFVSADHQSCIDKLKERYPNRIIEYPKRGAGDYSPGTSYMSTKEASQDAITEMYLLGRNPVIVGSYLSSYVEVGWFFGECKGKVTIV